MKSRLSLRAAIRQPPRPVNEQRETEVSLCNGNPRDCFVAVLLAMTINRLIRGSLVDFDASLRYDLRPFGNLGADEGTERLGRAGNHFTGIRAQALVHVRL